MGSSSSVTLTTKLRPETLDPVEGMAATGFEITIPRPRARLRVVIADADAPGRAHLRLRLQGTGTFVVAAEAADGQRAIDKAIEVEPHLVMLAAEMPVMDGIQATRHIRRICPDACILVYSTDEADSKAEQAIDAGADAYLNKTGVSDEMIELIEELCTVERASHGSQPAIPSSSASPPLDMVALLEAALISSPVGIMLYDTDGRVVVANPEADRLLGGSPLLGRDPSAGELRWTETGEPVKDDDLPILRTCRGEPFEEIELSTKLMGSYRDTDLILRGRPVFTAHGRPAGAVITVYDDSPRRASEQALAAAHAELERSNSELEQFGYAASHDLSQPLQAIMGYAQLLLDSNGDRLDERGAEVMDRIMRSVEKMDRLISNLLEHSRFASEALSFGQVDLSEVVAEITDLFEERISSSGAHITTVPLPTVRGDRIQITRLFQNLIANALTYVAPERRPEIGISAQPVGDRWQLTVADNGLGIAAADRERAFQMFQRLAPPGERPGTGIGLATCRKIVERHGGRIWIEDNPGGGSRFCFTLPGE